jgi:protein SCO1
MPRLAVPVAIVLLMAVQAVVAGSGRYAVTGLVLEVDVARRTFVASIERIPGFMEAMTMPFEVRDAAELSKLQPGMLADFTLVVDGGSSYVEGIRVRHAPNVEPDPLAARRLALLRKIASGIAAKALPVGAAVPDFTLTDQRHRRVSLSQFRGRVVAINFTYTSCQLPDFCLRIVNHFGVIRKPFAQALGRELVFLTITFDPARDTPEVMERYARQWRADPETWRFLTGPVADVRRVLETFGVAAFPDEGMLDHSLHTLVIDREGRLAAHVEGNQHSADQLADLVRAVLERR